TAWGDQRQNGARGDRDGQVKEEKRRTTGDGGQTSDAVATSVRSPLFPYCRGRLTVKTHCAIVGPSSLSSRIQNIPITIRCSRNDRGGMGAGGVADTGGRFAIT